MSSANERNGRRGFLRAAGAAIVGGGAAVTIARSGARGGGVRGVEAETPEAKSGARRVNVAPRAVPSVRK